MDIKATRMIHGTRFLNLFEREFEHKGREGRWIFASRDSDPPTHDQKRPDAVIVVPVMHNTNDEVRLVLTSEYRVPIATRELSFPAGLIDKEDYDVDGTVKTAVETAAKRECFEETNLTFVPEIFSPPNLYATAGLTNESAAIVMGKAYGEPSNKNSGKAEDIEVVPVTLQEIVDLMNGKGPFANYALSVRSWMMMRPIVEFGWPKWVFGTQGNF